MKKVLICVVLPLNMTVFSQLRLPRSEETTPDLHVQGRNNGEEEVKEAAQSIKPEGRL
ncbi:hypothetical protein BMS3Bbin06_00658 [bacterium BMS3Bbin06]|nr:hypothetical protein BMS3Abin08_02354 [bacterium BMS3Abin08]GBE34139.1 hypothetical protein BMS3Bbin06_00658 [bacterium BMS3Bbin06]